MTNKVKYIIFGTSALLIIGGIVAVIVIQNQKPQNDSETKDDRNIAEKLLGKITNTQTDAPYPLKRGSKGKNVINVNIALGLAPSNEFGEQTENALLTKFKIREVTESDYNSIKKLIKL